MVVKKLPKIGAGAGGGAAGALDTNSHDAPRKAAQRKNLKLGSFSRPKMGEIARFWGTFWLRVDAVGSQLRFLGDM